MKEAGGEVMTSVLIDWELIVIHHQKQNNDGCVVFSEKTLLYPFVIG